MECESLKMAQLTSILSSENKKNKLKNENETIKQNPSIILCIWRNPTYMNKKYTLMLNMVSIKLFLK